DDSSFSLVSVMPTQPGRPSSGPELKRPFGYPTMAGIIPPLFLSAAGRNLRKPKTFSSLLSVRQRDIVGLPYNLSNRDCYWLGEDRAGIAKAMKLPIFPAGVGRSRQAFDELQIKVPSYSLLLDQICIRRADDGPEPGVDKISCKLVGGLLPKRKDSTESS